MIGASRLFTPLTTEMSSLIDRARRSVVQVVHGSGQGSGVLWNEAGWIVTNDHVVAGNRAGVELADGRRLPALVLARDPRNDLALLRVEAQELPAAIIGDSSALRVGELVLAIGHPFGVVGTATLGILSSAPGTARWGRSGSEKLLADMELAPGNSGGPWINTAGQVIGIASMIVSPGIAVAVPSHVVQAFAARYAHIAGQKAA